MRSLPDLGLEVLYRGWQTVLHAIGGSHREHALAALAALAPLAARLAGTASLPQVARSAAAVFRTWP